MLDPAARPARLSLFLQQYMEAPFEWAVSDCSLRPAFWVEEETGLELLLPDYQSKREALELIAEAGGLVRVWMTVLDRTLPRTAEPALGDVAVIALEDGETGAIFGHNGIAYVWGEDGCGILQPRKADILAAWKVP